MTKPITSMAEAVLAVINSSTTFRQILDGVIADTGYNIDPEDAEDCEDAENREKEALKFLEANAPKCPGCKKAYTFQRQKDRPNLCSWCGYDHDSGQMSQLVPA